MLTKNRIKKPFLKHFLEITLIILMELLNIPILELNNQINMEPRSSAQAQWTTSYSGQFFQNMTKPSSKSYNQTFSQSTIC